MRTDVLLFLALADKSLGKPFSCQTHSLGNTFDIITPIDPSTGYGQWKHVKNIQGWPWDIKLYDQDYIYDWVTEGANGWSIDPNIGPKSYKKFIKNHLNTKKLYVDDGLVMFPRFVESQDVSFDIDIEPELTTYLRFSDCSPTGASSSLGPVHQKLSGPFLIDHGNNVGFQPTLVHQYHWNDNGVPMMEENCYALYYGWVSWKLLKYNYTTGLFNIVNITVSNTLKTGTPKIVFPCF